MLGIRSNRDNSLARWRSVRSAWPEYFCWLLTTFEMQSRARGMRSGDRAASLARVEINVSSIRVDNEASSAAETACLTWRLCILAHQQEKKKNIGIPQRLVQAGIV